MSSAETSEELSSLFSRIFRDRDGDILIPFILEITTPTNNRERVILINPITHRVIVVNASQTLETLLQDLVFDKHGGHPPASKASIQAMPTVTVDEEEDKEEAECSICLDSWKVAKEMPCKHRFHGECIEKWLSVHGSCPVCRFLMPVDQSKVDDDDNNHVEEETEDDNTNTNSNSNTSRSSSRFRVSVSYVIGRGSDDHDDDQAHDDDDVFHDSLSGDVN